MNRGSWLQNYPHFLEIVYQVTLRLFSWSKPLFAFFGYNRVNRWISPAEDLSKQLLFDCQMCGQCILHSTGMTCPMTCPKNLRNGPCGGVRTNGHCEVIPEMKCVWVAAFERSQNMPVFGSEMILLQPPVNRQLEGSSAWINMLNGQDRAVPDGWREASPGPVINIDEIDTWKRSTNPTAA